MGITGGQIRNPCKSPVDKGFQKYIIIWFFKIQECLLFVFFSSSFRWVQPCFMNEDILVLEEACFHSLSDPAISKLQNQHSNLPVQAITPENWIMDIQTILWSLTWGKKKPRTSLLGLLQWSHFHFLNCYVTCYIFTVKPSLETKIQCVHSSAPDLSQGGQGYIWEEKPQEPTTKQKRHTTTIK